MPAQRRLLDGPEATAHPPAARRALSAPEHVNAQDQRQDPDSLWSYVRTLIRRYRQMPQIGWCDVEVLDHDVPAVLAHVARCDELAPAGRAQPRGRNDAMVTLDLGPVPEGSVLRDVLDGREDQPLDRSGRVEVRVDGHHGPWLRVLAPGEQAYA